MIPSPLEKFISLSINFHICRCENWKDYTNFKLLWSSNVWFCSKNLVKQMGEEANLGVNDQSLLAYISNKYVIIAWVYLPRTDGISPFVKPTSFGNRPHISAFSHNHWKNVDLSLIFLKIWIRWVVNWVLWCEVVFNKTYNWFFPLLRK